MVWFLVLVFLGCVLPAQAAGPRKVPLGQPIRLTLEVGYPTMVTLPEDVHHIWAINEDQRFSTDYNGPFVGFKLFDATYVGRVFAVGRSGTVYQFDLKAGSPADVQVQVLPRAQETPKVKPQPFTIASFLRTLYHGTAVPEQVAIDMPTPAVADSRIALGVIQAVALGDKIGMVLPVTNTTPGPLTLDIRIGEPSPASTVETVSVATWGFPPRHDVLAVWTEDDVLQAGGATRMYLIFRKRP